jgi:hypothetical protein
VVGGNSGVGGVLMRFMDCMRWGYGKISGGVEGSFYGYTKFEVNDGSKIRFRLAFCGVFGGK